MHRIPESFLLLLATSLPLGAQSPAVLIKRAVDRMGGQSTIERVERVRFEQMTLWHRQTFENRPYGDLVGSYERVSDLRDYTVPAWRNIRRFVGPALTSTQVVDLVTDSVAARFAPTAPDNPAAWAPLNVAYVDERRELFAFTPDRLLLLASRATDARLLADTVVDGAMQARVAVTIDRFPATLFLDRATGYLTRARYRAAQPNDFGLARFGEMEVEIWYSNWRTQRLPGTSGLRLPMQWDVSRLGRPYKRITVLGARFDLAATPDSFVVSDALRSGFAATASRPMWEMGMDSARMLDSRFALLAGPPVMSPAAVKVGNRWVLLEGPTVPLQVDRELSWLGAQEPGARFGALLVTTSGAPLGGLAWFARARVPALFGRGIERGAREVLQGWPGYGVAPAPVTAGRWLTFDSDSLWVEPFDAPGFAQTLLAWVPSLKWLYHAGAIDPLVLELLLERARTRGWAVERIGHVRAVNVPLSAQPAPSRP